MVRPRLVEEGVPIGSTDYSSIPNVSMDTDSPEKQQAATLQRPLNSQQSSLLQASGGRVAQGRRHKTSITIGGEMNDPSWDDIDEDWNNDDEMPQPSTTRMPRATPVPAPIQPPRPIARPTTHEIGADNRVLEKMEGVERHDDDDAPLIVMDGANLCYAYAKVLGGSNQPNLHALQVAVEYFQGLRLSIVLPAGWWHKPELHNFAHASLLVPAPATDDDDAYAICIARRSRHGFVLSNDHFRDAQQRDVSLIDWLHSHRISYAFGDTGAWNDHGESQLDLVPNPRHALVAWWEGQKRQH